MKTYLVVMYVERKGKTEKLEFMYRCEEKELKDYWKQEIKILEGKDNTKVKSIYYFLLLEQIDL